MNTYRKTAIIVGVLFIIGTVAGVISFGVTGPILGDEEYLFCSSLGDCLLLQVAYSLAF
jgi:hypothetical protein